jgi:hypothetical protein
MSFGTNDMDRMSRRILAAMIVAGAMLTMLSFLMQVGQGGIKSRLSGLMDRAGSLISSSEAPPTRH